MFVNLSNHPSATWPANQTQAALALGAPIVDLDFPQVDPGLEGEPFHRLAAATAAAVLATGAQTAMVQGEHTLVYTVVGLLRKAGVRCVAATSHRDSTTTSPAADQSVQKTSVHRFQTFREYQE